MNKKGISLVVLMITIVLMIILVGITVAGIGNAMQNARKSSFANDLVKIEDAIEVFYVQNGNFPIVEEDGKFVEYVYDNEKLNSLTGNTILLNELFLDEFKNELISNFDLTVGSSTTSDTIFYKVDLSKLDIEKIRRGTGKDGENDMYVMSYPSKNVYYIKGLKVDENIYFSKINILNTKKNQITNEEVTVQTVENITVTKSKKTWTNKLGINISANLDSNEKLYVKLPVRENEIELSTSAGENNITINSLSGSLSMTDDEVTNFNNLTASEKIMSVIKRTDGVKTSSINVDISNYETQAPVFPLKADGVTFDFGITPYDGYNEVTFVGNDDISGIAEVRFVYLTEFSSNLSIKTLYEDTSILTPSYMLQNGKKADVSGSGKVTMKLPKDIEAIYITMYDKAGNSVSMQKNVQTGAYIGINATNITSNLKFNIAVKSEIEVAVGKAWISLDGVNFIDEKILNLTKTGNDTYESTVEFENSQNKEVYIKVSIYDNSDSPVEQIRIKKINLEEVATQLVSIAIPGITYAENRWYTDKNGEKAIVPAGLRVSTKADEQIINDGLVILDKSDNEYVFIPCTLDGANGTVKYAKWNGSKNTDYTVTKEQVEDDTLPAGVESETYQIEKYGGFYIARYEAGLPDVQTTDELMATKTFSADDNNRTDIGKAQSKADKIVWNRIDYTNAKKISENVLSTNYVQTGLVTGTQWDTMLTFLSQEVDVDVNCTDWGNYQNKYGYTINGYYRIEHADVVYIKGEYTKSANINLLLTTGKFGNSVLEGIAKNMYDVAGNVWEWTTEIVIEQGGSNTVVGYSTLRGGSYTNTGTNNTTSTRFASNSKDTTNQGFGFRFVLYVK